MSGVAAVPIELPCYTLIHMPQDTETPNDMKLKEDLEKGDMKVIPPLNQFIRFQV